MASTQLSPEELSKNNSPRLAGVTATLLLLSTVAIVLRVYVRVAIAKSFGIDDLMALIAFTAFLCYCCFCFAGIYYGTGRHVAALSPSDYSNAMRNWWFCEIFYSTASTMVRIAVGTLLLRLTTIRWHRTLIHVMMALSATGGIILLFEFIYQCQPIKFMWSYTRDPLEGHCIDPSVTMAMLYMHGAVACLGDWTLGVLPWFLVKDLNMNKRTKVTVGALLCLANFGSVATVIRFYSIKQISTSHDFLWVTVDLAIWSSVEIGTALPAACLVTLRPLFRNFFSTQPYNSYPLQSGPKSGGGHHHPRFRGMPGSAGYPRSGTQNKGPQFVSEPSRGPESKSTVTTNITSAGTFSDRDVRGGMPPLSDTPGSRSSDEEPLKDEPLKITRDYQFDVKYSREV